MMSFVVCSTYAQRTIDTGMSSVWHACNVCVRRKMETDRITIRLPRIYLRQVDLFIRVGEFSTRSEVIRHAVKEFISSQSDRIVERANKLKKVQRLEAAVEAIEPYMKK